MFKGEEYKTIISSSPTGRGRIWLDRNLGATTILFFLASRRKLKDTREG
jgi:hypothetical protein